MTESAISAKDELIAAFDSVLSYQWESLSAALQDVTEEIAWYQHPAYTAIGSDEGYPPAGTIMWHLVHLAHCYMFYRGNIIERPDPIEEPPTPQADSLEEAINNLNHHRARLRETLVSLGDQEFNEPLKHYSSVSEQMRMMIRHDAWHGGQISMIKRIYNAEKR